MRTRLTPQPLKTLTTPLTLVNLPAQAIPRLFISCIEEPTEQEITQQAAYYNGLGWDFRWLPTGHDAMITLPEALAAILMNLTTSR